MEVADQGLSSRRILAAIRGADRPGETFHYSAVEGRLEQLDQDKLAELVFDKDRPAPSIEEGRDALEALRRQTAEARYREVRRKIVAAEKSGDQAGIAELLGQKMQLERELGLAGGRRS